MQDWFMANLPNLLSIVRLLLVPVLLVLASRGQARPFLGLLIGSLATDVADGWLARRFNLATPLGARLDSWADFLTWLALPVCAWWLRPEALRREAVFIGVGILFYLAATTAGFLKFGRLTSYHTWAAKLSFALFGAAVLVFFSGGPSSLVRWIIPVVMLTAIEEIAITLTLPELVSNVPSLWHARRVSRRLGVKREKVEV